MKCLSTNEIDILYCGIYNKATTRLGLYSDFRRSTVCEQLNNCNKIFLYTKMTPSEYFNYE